MDEKWDQMDSKLKEAQQQIKILNEKLKAALSPNAIKKITHSADFWINLKTNCAKRTGPFGSDAIKKMIKNGQMTVNDVDPNRGDKSLLITAVQFGAYDLVQFLINNGVDIDAKDKKGRTALSEARVKGYSHIEKVLLFAKMNVEAGNEIKEISKKTQKQNGINEVLSNELKEIGAQSQKLYEQTLMELMKRMIEKRKTFCDNQLVYAFDMAMNENEDVLKSELWLTIRQTVSKIVQEGTKTDWAWMKLCLLPSMIWYKDLTKGQTDEPHYLYFELLKLVNLEAMNQINELETNISKMADAQKEDWNALIEWNIPGDHQRARQDKIVNGILSTYEFDQLSVSSDSTFNAPSFYDHNQYLSQLALLAQIVDDEFQRSVQSIFDVNEVTHQGKIESSDNKNADAGIVEYMRGPVKLIERARAKAQNDYFAEAFPSSACVIDFNRCTLIFDDISSLLRGLKLFVNKVKYYQSGNIIAIARAKNGFIEYVKEAQYADVKLNVVIKGRHNSIIGEVQFLLRAMKEYKDKAHNLYAIQRKEHSVETSVCSTLPILLDRKRQIHDISCSGNVKNMCAFMVLQNPSIENIMFVDPLSGRTMFHSVCIFGHLEMLKFLESIMNRKEFIDQLFLRSYSGRSGTPIEYGLSSFSIAEYLFSMKEVQARYKDNDPLLFRLCVLLFGSYFVKSYSRGKLHEFVLSALNVTKEKIVQMLSYKCPAPPHKSELNSKDHKFNILTGIWYSSTYEQFQAFVEFIGDKAFVANVFNVDQWNKDLMQWAIGSKNMKTIQYVLGFEEIRKKYMTDKDLLFRLCQSLNGCIQDTKIVQDVVESLKLTKTKLNELNSFRQIDVSKILLSIK